MTTQRTVLIESQAAPTAQTTLYTATVPSTIDKMTATNTDTAAQTISVNLVPPGGTAGASNLFVKQLSIAAGQSYQFLEISGHDLAAGGFISVIASSALIALRASGRVTTAN